MAKRALDRAKESPPVKDQGREVGFAKIVISAGGELPESSPGRVNCGCPAIGYFAFRVSEWRESAFAAVVHEQRFLEQFHFTHVMTVDVVE
jgi:hypothetical protein